MAVLVLFAFRVVLYGFRSFLSCLEMDCWVRVWLNCSVRVDRADFKPRFACMKFGCFVLVDIYFCIFKGVAAYTDDNLLSFSAGTLKVPSGNKGL